MVIVRLQRLGTKKTPHHRIVVTDKQRAQSGRVLEILGYYDPSTETPKFALDQSRLVYWVSSGAQVSPAVQHLVKRHQKLSLKR
jgi:small subunit ribosomal protein S16